MATPMRLAGIAELGRGRVGGLLVEVGDHDLGALAREDVAISLPMPLAAPVTMATLSLRRMSRYSRGGRLGRRFPLCGRGR